MVIAHHLDPLVDTRKLVKEAEKLAKGMPEKNALAVTLAIRNGGTWSVHDTWSGDLTGRLNQWATLLDREEIPDSLVFELERSLAPLGRSAGRTEAMPGLVERLLKRAVTRRRPQHDREAVNAALDKQVTTIVASEKVDDAIASFAAELRIARVLRLAYRAAWGPAPRTPRVPAASGAAQ
jgi:hypothetical protein